MAQIAKPGAIWNNAQFTYDNEAVHTSGDERISGVKSFVQGPRFLKQYVAAATTLISGSAGLVVADTTVSSFTITLPASPHEGDWFAFVDGYGQWGTNNLLINPNGISLDGSASTVTLSTSNGERKVVYDGVQWHTESYGNALNSTFTGEVTGTDFKATGLSGVVSSASRYVGATASGAPASGTFAVGDFIIDQTGAVWVCTAAGTPGTWARIPSNPKITASAISGGPPASPNNDDIWIALAAGSGGQNWQFIYNASSASAYKWEFIGGSEALTNSATGNKGGGSAWTDIATLTIPRAGDYIFKGGMWASGPSGGAATQELGFGLNSTTTVFATGASTVNSSASYPFFLHTEANITGLTASEQVYLNLWSNGAAASVTPAWVWFSIIPIRIS